MNRLSDIVKDLSYHVLSTAIFSSLIFAYTRSFSYAFIVIIGGVFIDADHFIDYFLYLKKFTVTHLVRGTFLNSGKVYLFLHAWELIAAGLFVSLAVKNYGLYLFFMSLAMHLAIDNVQRGGIRFYFLTYRCWKRFDLASLAPEFSKRFALGQRGDSTHDHKRTQ